MPPKSLIYGVGSNRFQVEKEWIQVNLTVPGGGLGYSAGRFAVKLNARGLVAHRDAAYEEWGLSGSVRYTPREDGRDTIRGRGLDRDLADARDARSTVGVATA